MISLSLYVHLNHTVQANVPELLHEKPFLDVDEGINLQLASTVLLFVRTCLMVEPLLCYCLALLYMFTSDSQNAEAEYTRLSLLCLYS